MAEAIDTNKAMQDVQRDIGTYYDYKENDAYPEVVKAHLEVVLPKIESFNQSLNPSLLLSVFAMSRHINTDQRSRIPEKIPTKVFKKSKETGAYVLHGFFEEWGSYREFYGRRLLLVDEEFVLFNDEQGLGVDANTFIFTKNNGESGYYAKKLKEQLEIFGSIEKEDILSIDGSIL